jgi:hypothetical protein
MKLTRSSFEDPHVTIVGARTDGQNGVRWLFRCRNSGN